MTTLCVFLLFQDYAWTLQMSQQSRVTTVRGSLRMRPEPRIQTRRQMKVNRFIEMLRLVEIG